MFLVATWRSFEEPSSNTPGCTKQRVQDRGLRVLHEVPQRPSPDADFNASTKTRSSSREVRIGVPFFSVVYCSRGTLPQEDGCKGLGRVHVGLLLIETLLLRGLQRFRAYQNRLCETRWKHLLRWTTMWGVLKAAHMRNWVAARFFVWGLCSPKPRVEHH